MILTRYTEFLLESILYTSTEFKSILSEVDDPIAKDILRLIGTDIRTNYNILNVTDSNDALSFISDTQSTLKLKTMSLEDILSIKSNNKTSIGRITRSILNDNGITKTDIDIQKFVNKFKAVYDRKNSKEDSIRIVRGEDIRKWYLEDNYCKQTLELRRGSLGKSCMRHEQCQDFLDIYVENPGACGLLINVDETGKLRSRALVWKLDIGIFLDRIYYTLDSEEVLLSNWMKNKFKDEKIYFYDTLVAGVRAFVQLDKIGTYERYPYMDSLPYFYSLDGKLFNYDPDVTNRKNLYYLQDTDGEYEVMDMRYCEYTDDRYPEEECIWSVFHNSYLHKDDSVWSNYCDSYLYKNSALFSKIINDYINNNSVIYVNTGKEVEYYPNTEEYRQLVAQDEISGNFFLKELLFEHKGRFYDKANSVYVYDVLKESWEKYSEVYPNSKLYKCSALDVEIFGFKISSDFRITSKRTFAIDVYLPIYYNKILALVRNIKGLDAELMSKKIDEINECNNILKNYSASYLYNNIFYDKFELDEDKFFEWYREKASQYFDIIYHQNYSHLGLSKEDINIVKYYVSNPVIDGKYIIDNHTMNSNVFSNDLIKNGFTFSNKKYTLSSIVNAVNSRILHSFSSERNMEGFVQSMFRKFKSY